MSDLSVVGPPVVESPGDCFDKEWVTVDSEREVSHSFPNVSNKGKRSPPLSESPLSPRITNL